MGCGGTVGCCQLVRITRNTWWPQQVGGDVKPCLVPSCAPEARQPDVDRKTWTRQCTQNRVIMAFAG